MLDPSFFVYGMRQLAGAVTVVTTGGFGEDYEGLTATAVCSLTDSPPSLITCVNRSAGAHDAIRNLKRFCVNVLNMDQQSIASQFSDTSKKEERFGTGEWITLRTGAPALKGAIANFDCRLQDAVVRDTHTVFLGEVISVSVCANLSPLLYHDGDFAGLSSLSK